MGKAKSFQGVHRSRRMLLNGWAFFWNMAHWYFPGFPFPRYGSRAAVSSRAKAAMLGMAEEVVGTCAIFSPSSLVLPFVLSIVVGCIFSSDPAGLAVLAFGSWCSSLGCGR